MTNEQIQLLVENAARDLSEHFDAVQILVSWNEESISKNLYSGAGNWYARQGMAHDFINQDVAQENARQLGAKIQPPPDDGEVWKQPSVD